MFEYINKKTGARISSPDVLFGENWQRLGEEVKEDSIKVEDETNKEKETSEKNSGKDEITKKDIMIQLDAMGVEYDPKARKDELYKLMMGE